MVDALAFAAFLLCAPPSAATGFIQSDWAGGAAPRSTTSIPAVWRAYDSQDGNVLALSTAVVSLQGRAGSWTQSDDGTGMTGFLRPGSSFSSTTVVGNGTGAGIQMISPETFTVEGAQLSQPRGDGFALYNPGTQKVYFGGGSVGAQPGPQDANIFSFDPSAGSIQQLPTNLTAGAGYLGYWGPGAVYHPGIGAFVLFEGGLYDPSTRIAHATNFILAYTVSPGQCTPSQLFPQQYAGYGIPGVYFPPSGLIYAFGGMRDEGPGYSGRNNGIFAYDAFAQSSVPVAAVLPSSRAWISGAYDPGTRKIYLFGGQDGPGWGLNDPPAAVADTDAILRYDPVADTVTIMGARLPSPRHKAVAVYFPGTGHILVFGGTNASGVLDEVVDYDPAVDSATVRLARLPTPRAGMAAVYDSANGRIYLVGASSGPTAAYAQILEYKTTSSGTYIASVLDTGNLSQLTSISWSSAVPPGTTLGISVRSGSTPTPDASWSNAGGFMGVSNGGGLAPFSPARYVQYSATFTSVGLSTSPTLNDITIAYTQTTASATLISTAFDTGYDSTRLKQISWQGLFPAGTTAQFQIRTASDNGAGFPAAWTAFLGPTSSTDYYASAGGSDTINALQGAGVGDRWLQYRLVLGSSNTANAASVSTVAFSYVFNPPAPLLTALTADSSTHLTLQWTDESPNEDEFVLSTGTSLDPVSTGAAVATLNKPGIGGTQGFALTGLTPNATYYARLRSHVLPPDDLYSPYSNELSAMTQAEPPSSPQVSGVSLSSMTFSWSRGANPGNTPFEVSLSTDGFQTNFSTPVPFSAGLTAATTAVMSLSAGTTYYLRVRAENGAGMPTLFTSVISTPTAPSGVTAPVPVALGISSISWTWASAGPAASYRLTNPATGNVLAVTTVPIYAQTGLQADVAYGLRVEPFTGTGSGGLSPPATRYTLADAPSLLSVAGQVPGAVVPFWLTGANPMGVTVYEVSTSTDGFVASFSTPVPVSSGDTNQFANIAGLAGGTTWYFRVRGVNAEGVFSAFSNVGSTITFPATLAAPSGAALGSSSISWTWAAAGGPAVTSYEARRATDGALLQVVTSASFAQTGLSPNAPYGLAVAARDATGAGNLSPAATVYSAAEAPMALSITALYVSSAALSWSTGADPPGTPFSLEAERDSNGFRAAGTVTGSTQLVTGLAGPSTWYFRVRATNGDGVTTPYAALVSAFVPGTPPGPPRAFTATPLGGGRIALAWQPSPSSTPARYDLYFDSATGSVDYTLLYASFPASATSYVTPPLSLGSVYRFALRSQDGIGQEEKNTSVVAAAAALASLSGVSAAVVSPAGGLRVAGDRLTLLAALVLGKASAVSAVRFQYKASTTAAWADVPAAEAAHPNPAASPPYYVHWDVTGLAAMNYDLRAAASDLAGTPDRAPPSVTVAVDPAGYELHEYSLGAGRIEKDQTVYGGVRNVLDAADGASALVARVTIPAGALAGSTATASLVLNPAGQPPSGTALLSPGMGLQVALSGAQSALAGGQTASLVLTYADADGNGLVDGTLLRADDLRLYAYDVPSGAWRMEAPSSVDLTAHTLTGSTPHFSSFGAFVPAHADLAALRVYPNPYRPDGSNPNAGHRYSPDDPLSGVIFDSLPPETTVKVYTVTGQLVRALGPPATGRLQWDARNADGHDVASGVYLAVFTSPGQSPVVRKVAVLR